MFSNFNLKGISNSVYLNKCGPRVRPSAKLLIPPELSDAHSIQAAVRDVEICLRNMGEELAGY
jgi:hypothetical protein